MVKMENGTKLAMQQYLDLYLARQSYDATMSKGSMEMCTAFVENYANEKAQLSNGISRKEPKENGTPDDAAKREIKYKAKLNTKLAMLDGMNKFCVEEFPVHFN
jgi:hypothetical protein